MKIFSRVCRKVYKELTQWAISGGPIRRSLYYRFIDVSFSREKNAVGAGIATYESQRDTGGELYLLRRNIHRLEKALTMQPRRHSFALSYLGETIRAYVSVVKACETTGWLESEEYYWINSVLVEYFDATRPSDTPKIQRLEQLFHDVQTGLEASECKHGPLHPTTQKPTVGINELLKLAEQRRSVRWFLNRPVDRDKVDKAVRVAQESPTACNRQPYRFYIFDDKASVQKIAEIPMGTAGFSHQIPGLIVVVGDLSAFFDSRDRHLIYVDSCLATMGLLLGLESQGVASCSINWPDMPQREEAMAQLLGLKEYERVIMLVAYGYADERALVPYSAKKTLEEAREFRK